MTASNDSIWLNIFPRQANNDYQGSKIALYAFVLLCLPLTFRGFVHFLKDDGGINSIASIMTFPGTPDPDTVVHLFASLWGNQQLITLLLYVVVLLRYRNLLPLLWITVILENLFRWVSGSLHPLSESYYEHVPPGSYGTTITFVLGVVMLYLSLRTRLANHLATDATQSRI